MGNLLTTWKRLSEPAKASVVFLLSTMILKGIVFLTTPVFTRIMSKADMGLVGTYQSWKGIFETFAIFSMTSAGVFNVGMSKYRDLREKYMSNMVCLCAVFAALSGGLLWVFYEPLSGILQIPKSLILLMTLYAFIMPAQSFWVAKQRYEYRYRAVFFVTVISALLSQIAAMTAVINAEGRLSEVRLWSAAAVELPIGIIFMALLLFRGRQGFNPSIWGATLVFAIPLIPHYLSSIVLTASDRIMIDALDCTENAGIYTVVHGVGVMTAIIWGTIQGSVTPYIYDKLDHKDYSGIDSVAEKAVIGFGLLSVLICLFAPEAIKILGPESYAVGAYVVPPIIGAMFISCLYNLFSTIEFYHMKSIFITFASIVAATLNIVLNYLLIPKFGFIVAGYTTLISYVTLSAMHYFNMRKIEKTDIFNGRRLNTIAALLLPFCILPVFLYSFTLIRYLVAVILLLLMYLKRDLFKTMFSKKQRK